MTAPPSGPEAQTGDSNHCSHWTCHCNTSPVVFYSSQETKTTTQDKPLHILLFLCVKTHATLLMQQTLPPHDIHMVLHHSGRQLICEVGTGNMKLIERNAQPRCIKGQQVLEEKGGQVSEMILKCCSKSKKQLGNIYNTEATHYLLRALPIRMFNRIFLLFWNYFDSCGFVLRKCVILLMKSSQKTGLKRL